MLVCHTDGPSGEDEDFGEVLILFDLPCQLAEFLGVT